MSGTVWSKFFWADWLSDANLRRCSAAARGLWMDMLCLCAQAQPYGMLAKDGKALDATRLARNVSMSESEVVALLAELEEEKVFSRDRHGRIYSRRMVRDAKKAAHARKIGKKGGVATRDGERGIFARLGSRSSGSEAGAPAPISQKPEAKSQKPTVASDGGSPVARAARVMGVEEARLRRRSGWLIFGDMIAGLLADGCEAERDVWPTIERVAKRMAEPPSSPLYFRAAILDARDRRLGAGGPHAAGLSEWADRLAVYAAEGAWSSRWGPKPGEAGCLAPEASRLGSDDGAGEVRAA